MNTPSVTPSSTRHSYYRTPGQILSLTSNFTFVSLPILISLLSTFAHVESWTGWYFGIPYCRNFLWHQLFTFFMIWKHSWKFSVTNKLCARKISDSTCWLSFVIISLWLFRRCVTGYNIFKGKYSTFNPHYWFHFVQGPLLKKIICILVFFLFIFLFRNREN